MIEIRERAHARRLLCTWCGVLCWVYKTGRAFGRVVIVLVFFVNDNRIETSSFWLFEHSRGAKKKQ